MSQLTCGQLHCHEQCVALQLAWYFARAPTRNRDDRLRRDATRSSKPAIKSQIPNSVLVTLSLCLLSACANDNPNQQPAGNDGVPMADVDVSGRNQAYILEINSTVTDLIEGGDAMDIPVSLTRRSGFTEDVSLSASSADPALRFTFSFSDALLSNGETESSLTVQLPIGARPLQPSSRTILITANDGVQDAVTIEFEVGITPTVRPDVYLLAGQSNMLGFSEPDAREAEAGQLDASVPRILQLNPTGNDQQNFATASDFTNPASISAAEPRITMALDPLHDGFDVAANGKPAEFIGPGLSFAKRALLDTTANIILVPTAWSDTGFCVRGSNRIEGMGWNAVQPSSAALSGTLLHDRAIARANQAIDVTGGVLRGILWHQGEADSDDATCASTYADNLSMLATSLRTNIAVDARGAFARGANADIPFIVGTMAKGNDTRGNQLPFSDTKLLVDSAHRTISERVPFSAVVDNDDLVPPDYPCGEGSCIHFGALALREMGARYYERLISTLP